MDDLMGDIMKHSHPKDDLKEIEAQMMTLQEILADVYTRYCNLYGEKAALTKQVKELQSQLDRMPLGQK